MPCKKPIHFPIMTRYLSNMEQLKKAQQRIYKALPDKANRFYIGEEPCARWNNFKKSWILRDWQGHDVSPSCDSLATLLCWCRDNNYIQDPKSKNPLIRIKV